MIFLGWIALTFTTGDATVTGKTRHFGKKATHPIKIWSGAAKAGPARVRKAVRLGKIADHLSRDNRSA